MTTSKKRVVKKGKAGAVVQGVRMDKVSETVVRAAYRQARANAARMGKAPMDLRDDAELSLTDVVGELVLWNRATSRELVDCTTCNGDSDGGLDACPYCGDSDVELVESAEDDDAAEQPHSEPHIDVSEDDFEVLPPDDEDDTPPEDIEPDEDPDEMLKEKFVKAKKERTTREKIAKNVAKSPSRRNKVDVVVTGTEWSEPDENGEVHMVDRLSAEIVQHETDKAMLQVKKLDEAVERIVHLKDSVAIGIWQLGHEIDEVLTGGLWRLRINSDKKQAFRTFAAFCQFELGMSYSHANRLVEASRKFTKEQMERIGVAKCAIMLQLPPEMRNKLVDESDGKTVAQLSDEARKLRGKEAPAAPPKGAITVAMAQGMVELSLMARPKKTQKSRSDIPAKGITDEPWAMETLPNNVVVSYFVMKDDEGNLRLRIDRRRTQVFDDQAESDTEGED